MKKILLCCLLCPLLFCACSLIAPQNGRDYAHSLVQEKNTRLLSQVAGQTLFVPLTVMGGEFSFQAWFKKGQGSRLHVYLEGDGYAWKTAHQPSNDPTPHNPLGLKLALADTTEESVLYLARPCQYVTGAARNMCELSLWTNARYSPRVMNAMQSAINTIKVAQGLQSLAMYGFSGGGALAVLLAEERGDVDFLATVAANLDTDAWTMYHHVSPLTASRNPAQNKFLIQLLPQVHFVGTDDRICPPELTKNWCDGLAGCRIVLVENYGHGDAWETIWANLLHQWRHF